MRMSEEEYKSLIDKRQPVVTSMFEKPNKYRNKRIEVDGVTFDSKKELVRWQDLKAQQATGQIKELWRQVEYNLHVNDQLICTYIADFVYWRENYSEPFVEDVKSKATRKLPVYAIKKKLMKAIHGIEIQEI